MVWVSRVAKNEGGGGKKSKSLDVDANSADHVDGSETGEGQRGLVQCRYRQSSTQQRAKQEGRSGEGS